MKLTAKDSTAMAEFWRLFRADEAELATIKTADTPVYDRLLAQLHEVNPGLFLEFSTAPGARELVITANGKQSLFPLARAIVAQAPALEGWTILALRPKLGFPEAVTFEGVTVPIEGLAFDFLEVGDANDLGLRIYVPDLDESQVDHAANALLLALDTALGEEAFAETFAQIEVVPLPDDVLAEDRFPLADLENLLEELRRVQEQEGN